MDYRRLSELFHEFSKKLEEQHVYYLDSIVGFLTLHERMLARQAKTKALLGASELATDEFLDTTNTLYSELCGKDFIPMSLSPVMKQGDVKARTKHNGKNYYTLGANCIATLYSYWEEYLRIEIGIAKGVLKKGATGTEKDREILNKEVVSDLWGDIRYLRHAILHNKGIATNDMARCKIIKFWEPGEVIELDYEKMRIVFLKLAFYRNEIDKMSRSEKVITIG